MTVPLQGRSGWRKPHPWGFPRARRGATPGPRGNVGGPVQDGGMAAGADHGGVLDGFSPATRAWFSAVFTGPTPAQEQAWAAITKGEDTLVIAPTGSGKTLAAFLWALDGLAGAPPPADPHCRCRCLYVSPLKALAADIERNLRAPLAGIRHAAQRLGLGEPDIRVAVRTGDTPGDERRRLTGKPPDILITTPESLFLLLTSKARETLRSVETVIIDEVHALAGNKRGAHLALSLERLDALRSGMPGTADQARGPGPGGASGSRGLRGPAQRIGLSATVRPAGEVAAFLGGTRQVTVVQPPSAKRIELDVVVPVEDMADMSGPGASRDFVPAAPPRGSGGREPLDGTNDQGRPAGLPGAEGAAARRPAPGGAGPAGAYAGDDPVRRRSIWPHVEERVLDLIEQHRSTIVFANSRRLAERLCARLNELAAERAASGFLTPAGHQAPGPAAGPAARPAGDNEAAGESTQPPRWPPPGSPGPPGSPLPPGHGASRAQEPPAEIMAQAGAAPGAPAEVARAHHGSVSRAERTQIEEALKAGVLRAVVATSSLELGIDMGAVDLVVQVESPPSVASGLQRTGRAGHHVGDVSRGVIFPKYQGDLVQAAVVARRMRAGQIEQLRMPRNPLDVLAQQIIAMTAMDDWPVDELECTIRRAAPFAGLTRPVLESVLDMLAGRYPSEEFAGLRPRVVWDRVAGVVRGRPGTQRLAVTSGGTIPDRGLFGVFLAGPEPQGAAPAGSRRQSRRVGELDEEMVYESRVGDVFVLGASSWRIEDITADRVLVTPAPGQPGKLPFWHGDAPGRPAELGAAIGAMCRELAGASAQDASAMLRAAGLDELAAGNLLRYLSDQREATGCVPDDRTLVVERFRDELGDWRVVLHSPYGARVHAPWALAIAARLRERYGGMDVQALHTDDGIVIRVPDADEPPPPGIALLDPDEISDLVTAEVGSSALFASRFRECAARALLLPRHQPGRRMPLWQQRQRSAQLLEVASRYGSFPIVLETVRECLQDVFDVPALTGLLRDLAARKIRLVEVETPAPSPFSRSLLFRYVGAFMYEGDAPLAERRAQALTLDSALLAELLGQADLRELLDPEVIKETERGLQALAPGRACRDSEQLADLLARIGPLSAAEVAQRCADPAAAPGWLQRLGDALGVALPVGIPDAFTEPVADPLGDLVARYARCHGPFTAAALAQRYGLGVAVVTGQLRRLAADRRAVEGEFRPGGGEPEWCDAEVLRTLRRRCLAALRREAEPVPAAALAAFLPAWQNVAATGRRRGPAGADAVYEAIEQLAGAAVPASALESLVLPGRVPGYSPALLDELTAAGEVAWTGAGALPGGDGWVVLAPAGAAPLLFPAPGELTMTPVHEAVLAALDGGGALFFRALAERVDARLRADGVPPVPDHALAAAIWDLVWAGRLTNDTLAPLRTVLGAGRPMAAQPHPVPVAAAPALSSSGSGYSSLVARPLPQPAPGPWQRPSLASRSRAARPGYRRGVLPSRSGPPTASGRWSVPPAGEPDRTRRLHALAGTLLERHGVLLRGAAAAERLPEGGFAALYPVLRAMEETGRCRRGYFVEGLGAAQFALPGAVDRLRAIASDLAAEPAADPAAEPAAEPAWLPAEPSPEPAQQVRVLAATDPSNAYGAALPWPPRPDDVPGGHKPGRKAGALVILVGGDLVLYVERGGRTLLSWTSDPALLEPAAAALAAAVRDGALGRLTVERADGAGVHDTPLARALEQAGFRPTPRGLRLRG